MKTNLFFFSATGNSLIVAKDLAAKLPGTQIFSIPKVINQKIDLNADNIGLVFPVYFSGIPKIIIDFINKLESSKTKYIFAICTCGAFPMGTLLQTQKLLRAKGLTLNAGFSIQMPGNYLVKYGAYSIEKQRNMFIKEKDRVETIVKMITNQQDNKIERNNLFINGIGNLAYKSMLPKFPTLDQNFNVIEKCNSCNTCEKVCPVQNIKIINGRPSWQGNCEHCLACIQWCPKEAIQYSNKTLNRKRYHHPEVLVKELYCESE
jgi:ferredoxin